MPKEPSTSSQPLIPPPPPKSILAIDDNEYLELVTVFPTAIVVLTNAFNEKIPARAIFDTGTEVNVITESLANLLFIEPRNSHLHHSITNEKTFKCVLEIEVEISSRYSDFKSSIACQIASKLHTSVPNRDIDFNNFLEMPKSFLADPKFYKKGRIDMVIGKDFTIKSLLKNSRELTNGIFFKETSFGWAASGTFYDKFPNDEK